jgi:hypothetical protein
MSWSEYGFKIGDRIQMNDGLNTLGTIINYIEPETEDLRGRILIELDTSSIQHEFSFTATEVLTNHFEKVE